MARDEPHQRIVMRRQLLLAFAGSMLFAGCYEDPSLSEVTGAATGGPDAPAGGGPPDAPGGTGGPSDAGPPSGGPPDAAGMPGDAGGGCQAQPNPPPAAAAPAAPALTIPATTAQGFAAFNATTEGAAAIAALNTAINPATPYTATTVNGIGGAGSSSTVVGSNNSASSASLRVNWGVRFRALEANGQVNASGSLADGASTNFTATAQAVAAVVRVPGCNGAADTWWASVRAGVSLGLTAQENSSLNFTLGTNTQGSLNAILGAVNISANADASSVTTRLNQTVSNTNVAWIQGSVQTGATEAEALQAAVNDAYARALSNATILVLGTNNAANSVERTLSLNGTWLSMNYVGSCHMALVGAGQTADRTDQVLDTQCPHAGQVFLTTGSRYTGHATRYYALRFSWAWFADQYENGYQSSQAISDACDAGTFVSSAVPAYQACATALGAGGATFTGPDNTDQDDFRPYPQNHTNYWRRWFSGTQPCDPDNPPPGWNACAATCSVELLETRHNPQFGACTSPTTTHWLFPFTMPNTP
jgi:hypothetical protein